VVASAALAIVVAFASLGLADFGQFRVLGPSVALAVAVMLVAGVTLVPALLAATGKKLFWPSRSWQVRHDHGPASRLGAFVAHRSARIALVGTGVLVALSLAAVGGKMSYDLGSLPESAKAQQVQEQIDRILPKGVTDRQEIYVSSPTPLTAAALEPMRERLARVDKVGQVSEPVFADGGRAAQIDVALTISSVTSQALDLAGEGGPLRTAAHEAAPPGATAMVGGNASVFADVGSSVNKDLRLIFPVAAGLILLILVLMLRSVVAPFYLLVAVGLEFAATLGTAILVFQHGMGHDGVVFTLPLVLFLFVVAIGTDYNILMSARLREELGNGGSQRDATARAVRAVAPAIAAAGLVLAASFGSLMLNKDLNTREIGFAMAMGILVASLLVSTLLVPAVTTVIGERAWWPRNRRPRAGVESPAGEVSFQDAAKAPAPTRAVPVPGAALRPLRHRDLRPDDHVGETVGAGDDLTGRGRLDEDEHPGLERHLLAVDDDVAGARHREVDLLLPRAALVVLPARLTRLVVEAAQLDRARPELVRDELAPPLERPGVHDAIRHAAKHALDVPIRTTRRRQV
jgi:RND superfamily putative drug exporter